MKTKEIIRRTKLAKNVIDEVFKSIQLAAYYTLYYDQDFSKQQIKNFNYFLKQTNREYRMSDTEKLEKISEDYKKLGIDCRKMAVNIPYRAKVKMYGKPLGRDAAIVVNNATDSIEGFFLLGVTILRKHYKFSVKRILEWYEQIVEFSKLWADGMKDEHVVQYFIMACDLEISGEES